MQQVEVAELQRQLKIMTVADPSHHWWLKTPSRERRSGAVVVIRLRKPMVPSV